MNFLRSIAAFILGLFMVVSPVAGSTFLFPVGGGTGTSTAPTYGKMLVGNATGTYTLTATSSLGLAGVAGSSGQLQYNANGASGSVSTSSIGVSAGLTNAGTLGSQVGGSSLTLKQLENRSFTYSTTSWSGTTTLPLEVGYGELWNTVKCFTNTGTLNTQFGYGSASTSMFQASTTKGTITFTTNNTMTAGNSVKVDVGTPASAPTFLTCTVNDTI